ncbi:MAG TPA: hypothetical protein VLU25_03770 [Acidobacteriota bacterium]|nr:hypothetical protein [Acidobacteriota bacterium]
MRALEIALIALSSICHLSATVLKLDDSKIDVTNSGDSRLANGLSQVVASAVSQEHVGLILQISGNLGRQSLPCSTGGAVQRSLFYGRRLFGACD